MKNLNQIKFNKPDDGPFKAPLKQDLVGVQGIQVRGEIIGKLNLLLKNQLKKPLIIRDKYKEIVSNEGSYFGLKAAGILLVLIIILSYILKAINLKPENRRYRYTSKHSEKFLQILGKIKVLS